MALATRCPSCHALFRVVADQLKLRGGLVRCGACRHVFDAIGTLSYIDDSALAPPPAGGAFDAGAAAAAAAVQPPNPGAPTEDQQEVRAAVLDQAAEAPGQREAASAAMATGAEPFDLPDSGPAADRPEPTSSPDTEPPVPRTDDRLEPADAAAPAAAGEPEFLRGDLVRRKRSRSLLFGSGAALLAVLAMAQLAVQFRADILARFPEARPALTQLCRVFRCTVNWPARGDLLAVVGSELQALPGTNAFELTAVVRNRGSVTLALPAIELTLTDTLNRAVARKVFAPADYLAGDAEPAARALAGIEPGADLTVRIAFEARDLNAAGFVVYPFYL